MRYSLVGCALLVLAAGSGSAQYVISAHSGVVQYVEGDAYLNGQQVDAKFGHFPDIKDNQEFATKQGRAEILLTPGVFLRLGENSSIRMLSTRLTDTRVEVLHGSAIIECDDIPKDNSIQVVYNLDTLQLTKHGLYRVDTDPARLRVYDGEAVVKSGEKQVTVKGGKEAALDSTLAATSFDRKDDDELYRWSDRRASYVAQANAASATTASTNSYGSSGLGSSLGYGGLGYGGLGYGGLGYGYGFTGGWMFNPMFGMYTWLPFDGFGYSPFGYTYFSPYTAFYAPYYYGGYYGGSGYPVRTTSTSNTNVPVTRGGTSPFLGHRPAGGFQGGTRSAHFGGLGSSARAGGSVGGFGGGHAVSSFGGGHGVGGFGGGHAGSVGGGHGR